MGRLLKYAVVLALGIAIGVYIVLDDIVPDTAERDAITAHSEAAPPATPASIEEEELEYAIAKRLASLEGWRAFLAARPNGAHAQSARAEVARRLGATSASAEGPASTPALSPADNEPGDALSQRLGSPASNAQSSTAEVDRPLLAEKAPASGDPEASAGASSSETRAATKSTSSVSSPSGDAVPVPDAAVSHDASQDAKPADDAAHHLPPPAGADGATGAQLAALSPDEICQRDEDRLAQLRMNPSSNELVRFANELGCQKLLPQVVSLMKSLAPPPAAADVSTAASSDARTANETAPPAPPVAGADVAALTSDESCKRDGDRLVQLRSSPSGEEVQRFANELGCEKLRPQLQRLMESLDFGASAPRAPADRSHSSPLLGQACVSERSALDRLRQEPSAEAAGQFWRDMQCEGLRPQVRLLLESLNVAPDSVGSAAAPRDPEARGATSDARTAIGVDPAACRRETAELNRVRATPDLGDAKRFASTVTCDALKPQVARLLDSFGE